jgi:tetratricopeptide (TPR) repeat protein
VEAASLLGELAEWDADTAVRATAYAARGTAWTRLGRVDEAIEDLRRSIELRSNQPGARFQLANLLGQRGEYEQAVEQYVEVVKLQPRHHAARLGGATALALSGRAREARDLLEAGMRVQDPDPRVALILAQLLATAPDPELRNPQRAAALAGELFRVQPTLEHGETLAVALAGLGRFSEARELQQSLIDAVGSQVPPEVMARLEGGLEQYRRGEAAAPAAEQP